MMQLHTYLETPEAREQFLPIGQKLLVSTTIKILQQLKKKITTRQVALQKHKKSFLKDSTYKKTLAAQKSSPNAKKQQAQPKSPVQTQAHQKAQLEYKAFNTDKKAFERNYAKDIQHIEKNHDLLEQ